MLISTENGLPVRGMRGRNSGASREDRHDLVAQRLLGRAVEKTGEMVTPGAMATAARGMTLDGSESASLAAGRGV